MSNVPYLVYFVYKKKPDYPEGTTRIEIERDILTKALNHHYTYGAWGFLSERTTLEGIFRNLHSAVELAWNVHNIPGDFRTTLGKLAVTDADAEERKRKVEADYGDDFCYWYPPKQAEA